MNSYGQKVVFTAGTWDLFHIGHLNIIKKAREIADDCSIITEVPGCLIVGVVTDNLAASYKDKPIIPFKERRAIVAALKYVDITTVEHTQFNAEAMDRWGVDVVVVGEDWQGDSRLKELEQVCEVVFIPRTPYISTSIVKHNIKKYWKH